MMGFGRKPGEAAEVARRLEFDQPNFKRAVNSGFTAAGLPEDESQRAKIVEDAERTMRSFRQGSDMPTSVQESMASEALDRAYAFLGLMIPILAEVDRDGMVAFVDGLNDHNKHAVLADLASLVMALTIGMELAKSKPAQPDEHAWAAAPMPKAN